MAVVKEFLKFYLIFISLSAISSQIRTLDCDYDSKQVLTYKTTTDYTCVVTSDLPTVADVPILNINDDHVDGKTASDVTAISFISRTMYRIPKGVSVKFTNLNTIYIFNSTLRILRNEDLIDYKDKLGYLAITYSELEFIGVDTFNDLTSLISIDLRGNKIFYFESTVFAEVKANLDYLLVDGNLCGVLKDAAGTVTLTDVRGDNALIDAYVNSIFASKCGNSKDLSEEFTNSISVKEKLDLEIIKGKSDYDSLNTELDGKKTELNTANGQINTLNTSLNTCNDGKVNLQTEIDTLRSSVDNLDTLIENNRILGDNVTACNNQLTTINSEVENLNKNIQNLENQVASLEGQAEKCLDVNGTCRFTVHTTYGYSCIARDIEVKSSNDVVEWIGSHANGSENSLVVGLVLRELVIEVIPSNISTTFGNLKTFVVQNCGLKRITRNDFNGLTLLENLIITDNAIASIESSSLDGLTKLTSVDLSNNKLTSITSKLFAQLTDLVNLIVSGNQLTSLRYDLIPTTNKINLMNASNNRMSFLDIAFVWRINKAEKIIFTGNPCNITYDSSTGSFNDFFDHIMFYC